MNGAALYVAMIIPRVSGMRKAGGGHRCAEGNSIDVASDEEDLDAWRYSCKANEDDGDSGSLGYIRRGSRTSLRMGEYHGT